MDWITSLEKRFGSWAIPNLAVYLIAIQAIGVVLLMGNYADPNDLLLHGSSVMHRGQWWRLLSFMMLPKTMSPLWLFFAFYIFYMIGNSLEQHWGTFRFNLYVLIGYLLTVATAFINPGAVVTNIYFLGSVFLAFATQFPNVEFRLFFVLPVKVKWLGWLTAVAYFMTLFSPDPGSRLGVMAAFTTYFIFFGREILNGFKSAQRRKSFVAEQATIADEVRHACKECGATDKCDASKFFRYCSTCGECFCEEHMENHKH